MMKKKRMNDDFSGRVIRILGYLLISFLALSCLLPFLIMISASFENEKILALEGYHLIPKKFTAFAYEVILQSGSEIMGSYVVTLFHFIY